jgi:hypothetical protein
MKVSAACHIHSDWSYDGSWTLGALARKFAGHGYRVLMVTEHDRGFSRSRQLEHRRACAQASSETILVVPGIEYSEATNTTHVLVWGDVPFVGENVPTGLMLEAVAAANGVAVMAHPSRRQAWKSYDPAWTSRLLGIEAWNRKTDGWSPSLDAEVLLKATGVVPFAGMDFHTNRQMFPLSMDLNLTGAITEESILQCLRSKSCQAAAFGLPLTHTWLRRVRPVLAAAELARRTAARAYRKMKSIRPRASASTAGNSAMPRAQGASLSKVK